MKTISLSKNTILQQINCNDIYINFLGLSKFPTGNISSPFATDKNPSLKIYSNGTFKCNSSGHQGDVWQFVAYLHNLDSKTQFKEVLNIVVNKCNINLQLNCKNKTINKTNKINDFLIPTINIAEIAIENPINIAPVTINIEPHTIKIDPLTMVDNINFEVIPRDNMFTLIPLDENEIYNYNKNLKTFKVNVTTRPFTKNDLQYWQKIGVSIEILNRYNVLSVAKYQFYSAGKNKNFSFAIAPDKLCFAYQINENFEIYVPAQPDHNQPKIFINGLSHPDIFGLDQIHGFGGENIIICAGKKDTLTMVSRGFKAVSFRSETHHPTAQQIAILQSFCTNLFICYDADNGGTIGSNAIIQRFPFIKRIDLPPDENIKGFDVTDYFQLHTVQDFQKLIDNTVKK